jgi:hypothetical protein
MSELKLKRGGAIYKKNPSTAEAITTMKTGIKRISNKKGQEMILADGRTGEIITGVDIGFHERVKVDRTEFVKLYIRGVSAFTGLQKAGARVLELVISESNKNIGKDMLFLSQPRASAFGIPKATFNRGINELIEREILFNSEETNFYFININFIFNGDRLAFLKTYEVATEDNHSDDSKNQAYLS